MLINTDGGNSICNSDFQLLCLIAFQCCINWVTKMKSGISQGCEANRINLSESVVKVCYKTQLLDLLTPPVADQTV